MSSISLNDKFNFQGSQLKKVSLVLIATGMLCFLLGIFVYGFGDEHDKVRFWGNLLYNSVFMLLVVNSTMFFISACTLAMGGWFVAFRRIPEAISSLVPVMGVLTLVILFLVVFTHQHHIYHWLDVEAVEQDEVLKGKSGFLNGGFYVGFSVITLLLWSFLGNKLRQLSYKLDEAPLGTLKEKNKYIFSNTVWASLFIVTFGLTVGSTLPWLWIMSIDAHWYSTMFSWYTLISSFVAGLSLMIAIFVYLKKQDLLTVTTQEHLHDLGKFMFAFSIFWTYLWFSQFMLIWYGNIPEETVYFVHRFKGAYRSIFFLNILVNFFTPFLILMTKASKRNYNLLFVMAIILFVGHWLDFYQMVIPSLFKEHVVLGWYEFGLFAGFSGMVLYMVGSKLSKKNLVPVNHPYLKESIIYHT